MIEETLCNLVFKKKWYSEKKNETFEKKIICEGVKDELSIKMPDDKLTISTLNFLRSKSKEDFFYYETISNNICPSTHMNPHVKEDLYSEYFVDSTDGEKKLSHIVKFNDLLKYDENYELEIKKYRDHVIYHIGAKGSGKTLWLNVWLYNNNKTLEDNKILWIKLDVEKLYKIWNEKYQECISTKDYALGQMLYIICKHYQDREETKSPLIAKIINEFSESLKNEIHGMQLTKWDLETSGDDDDILFNYCRTKGKKIENKGIISLLKYFEGEIAQYENLKTKNDGRILISKTREKSFFIDKVLENLNSKLFKVWKIVAQRIYDFILENDYYILLLIDSIDNITFLSNQKGVNENILKQLYYNHLTKRNESVITIIVLRDYMYSYLIEYPSKYDYGWFRDKKSFNNIINQQENNLGKQIFAKRVDYIKGKNIISENCIVAEVLEKLKHTHQVDDSIWNANYRSLLVNHFSLAKYIAFKHYWRPEEVKTNIQKEIERYGNINFLLNGKLFVSKEYFKEADDFGAGCFNLFDSPKYNSSTDKSINIFIYIRLLLILKRKKKISQDIIIKIFSLFGIKDTICIICINKLVDAGLILQSFPNDLKGPFVYSISRKGEYALDKCFNDIHFLYYLSLDTYLPFSLLEHIKVAPNNIDRREKRKYPITCIVSGLTFLNYLFSKNKGDLSKIRERDLSSYDIKKSDLDLPINRGVLEKSMSEMVNIIDSSSESYSQEFYDWIDTIKQLMR